MRTYLSSQSSGQNNFKNFKYGHIDWITSSLQTTHWRSNSLDKPEEQLTHDHNDDENDRHLIKDHTGYEQHEAKHKCRIISQIWFIQRKLNSPAHTANMLRQYCYMGAKKGLSKKFYYSKFNKNINESFYSCLGKSMH